MPTPRRARYLARFALVAVPLSGCPAQHASVQQQSPHAQVYRTVCSKVDRGEIWYGGGDGSSPASAIRITGTESLLEGIAAEYLYLVNKHGEEGRDWRVASQMFAQETGHRFTILELELLRTNERRDYVFDVSEFVTPLPPVLRQITLAVSVVKKTVVFSASENFSMIVCADHWQSLETVWAAAYPQGVDCVRSVRYGDPLWQSRVGPEPLEPEHYYSCVVSGSGIAGEVSFCLNRRREIGSCLRE